MSTGQAESVLDPARTRPTSVRWKPKGPEIDRWCQSVKLGSGGVRFGSVGGESRRILQMSPESSKKSPESAKITRLHQKSLKSTWISSNLVGSHKIWSRSHLDLLESRWIHQLWSVEIPPNLTKYRRNQLGSHRISPNMAEISPDHLEYELELTEVGRICI